MEGEEYWMMSASSVTWASNVISYDFGFFTYTVPRSVSKILWASNFFLFINLIFIIPSFPSIV